MILTCSLMMLLFMIMGKKKSEVEPKLQTDGNNSKSWAKNHKMQIHYDKLHA